MNRRLVHEVAMKATLDIAFELGMKTEEDVSRTLMELGPVVERWIVAYEEARARMAHRLARGEKPADEPF